MLTHPVCLRFFILFITTVAIAPGASARVQVPTRTVVAAEVSSAPSLVSVPLTGSVQARRAASVSTQVAGYVIEVAVEVGDRVRVGDVLVELDPRLAQAAERAARARVDQARAQLQDVERQRDEAQALLARENVAETQFETLQSRVEQGRANISALEAEHERQRTLLERHVIRAPFDGVVAERMAEAGEWLMLGSTVLELRELAVVRVRADVPQALWSQVDVGTSAEVRFDAWPDQPRRAAVSIKVAVADASARTFPVFLELDNRDSQLTPGMSARIALMVAGGNRGDTLQVPRDALVRGPDGVTRVWMLGRGEADTSRTVEPVAVVPGRSFGDQVEVLDSPLQAGDLVVVRGNETLRTSQRVRVVGDQSGAQ